MAPSTRTLRIALAQRNYTMGDLDGNLRIIEEAIKRGRAEAADLVVFSECALPGYLPRDMIERADFVDRQLEYLERVAALSDDRLGVLVGFVARNPQNRGKRLHNAAALCHGGEVVGAVAKRLLPTYDVFEEARYFEPAGPAEVFEFRGVRLGVSICEDAWNQRDFWEQPLYECDPIEELVQGGAQILINLAASPFHLGKPAFRRHLLSQHASCHRRPLLFVNQVGGHDSLIFDGHSLSISPDGEINRELAGFEQDFALCEVEVEIEVELDAPPRPDAKPQAFIAGEHEREVELDEAQTQARQAIVLGLRDYVHKTGFRGAILGISGGIDSAMCAVLAAEALGPENVLGVAMPTRYTRDISNQDASILAKTLGIEFMSIPIEATFEAFLAQLEPAFAGRDEDVTEENLQARIRGATLMSLSNKFGKLVLVPGNKSEFAMGYSTLYGDMVGAICPLGDCFKTLVYAMARGVNADANREIIPARTIERAPSAELKPDQTDQDSLPPYDLLDAILAAFMHEGQSAAELVERGFDAALVDDVLSKLFRAEYKRRQAAPILKISPKAFGRGWRYPLAATYRHLR
jgi:NAD+ synthetase